VPGVGDANPTLETKSKPQIPSKSGSNDKPDDSYTLGIADELQISVWKEPDLSGSVVVRPDGMITLPVVDDVYVLGLTTHQVQDVLTQKLKSVVSEPDVTVIVRNIRSRKVYLVGQVGHPGGVSLTGHETVLQILAESGGPTPFAKADKIYILRKVGTQQEKLNFNYKKALKGSDPKADFALENGDVIVVP
jgi:polysaccharide export outer membrane protein